ncbi:MAG TPA: 50S ribosomal protein L24 [Candidatus Bilamarchaeum sp.]|nr:50S ribosomal protein L24 [Candidatus Bilamarchaeum sp.]
MKSDTERKKFYSEKLHKKKNRLHVHLSKDLRGKLKSKRRAVLVRKGDTVKVMRGPGKGKEARVGDVNVLRRVVFLEGIVVKNARGREVPMPVQPSNLLLTSLESTKERKEIFSEEAFRKKEAPKPKAEAKPDGHKAEEKPEAKAEPKGGEHAVHKHEEHKPAHSEHSEHRHAEHKPEHKAKHEHAK